MARPAATLAPKSVAYELRLASVPGTYSEAAELTTDTAKSAKEQRASCRCFVLVRGEEHKLVEGSMDKQH